MFKQIARVLIVVVTLVTTTLPMNTMAAGVKERPGAGEMAADLAIRPVYMVGAVGGAAVFLLGSPFSLLGGNFKESFVVLVGEPFGAAFLRCLGCKKTDRSLKIVEIDD